MQDLIINEELKKLLPPLTAEEYAGLEADILEHGCLTALITCNKVIVDGHNRYDICTKHKVPFTVTNIDFDSLDDAKLWAWKHQVNRRNLAPYHRAELALQFKGMIAAQAKERQLSTLKQNTDPASLPDRVESKETREELAKIAEISPRSMSKVEYIAEHADEETKAKLRRGEKGTSIDREYKRLKPRQEKSKTKTTIPSVQSIMDESSLTEIANNIAVSNTEPKEVVDTKQFLQKHYSSAQIRKLASDIASVFSECLRELPFIFFHDGMEQLGPQDRYEHLENFLKHYFEVSAPETRNCILRVLVDFANGADGNHDKYVLKKPRRTKTVKR